MQKIRFMKAIIVDLDRTLLHTDKSVSEYTVKVLRECRDRGFLILVASARPYRSISPYRDVIPFSAVTAMNGAITHLPDRNEGFAISRKCGEKIISDILKFPDIFLSVETSIGLYSNRDIPEWSPIIYDRFPSLPDGATLYKILVSSSERALYDNISTFLPDEVYYSLAKGELIQIMSSSATKWNGIVRMLNYFGISPDEAIYFGDDNDDIEPIRNCGIGVAVANAIPEVLNAADRITDGNDADGVAKFIEQNIF